MTKENKQKKSYFTCSLSANGRQNQKSKITNGRRKGWERWERSHPFQNSSHVLGFQWEDWDITVFCLDSFIHLIFPKLFNCWRAMRQEDSEFNVKNHFHFSPPTIEHFILFLVNDTLHYGALYDLLCSREDLMVPADSHNTILFPLTCLSCSGIQRPLFEITSPALSGRSWGLQAFYNFGALSQKCALKKQHWKELLVWGLFHGEGWWHTLQTWWGKKTLAFRA